MLTRLRAGRRLRRIAIAGLGLAGACADPVRPDTASVARIEVLVAGGTTPVGLVEGMDASAEVRASDAGGRPVASAECSLSVSDPTRLELELADPCHGRVRFLQRDRSVWVRGLVRDGSRVFRDSTLVMPVTIL
ncbi:MAG: hypothetical protein ACYC1S_01385 [Gemmatimonadaceae bacterium]